MITIFLGAGASKAFGYPTTKDFMESAYNNFKEDAVYREIISCYGKKPTIDIEIVLWELEKLIQCINIMQEPSTFKSWLFGTGERAFFNYNGTHRPFREFLPSLTAQIANLRARINRLVYDTYWREPDYNEYYKQLFELLEKTFKPDSAVNVFTTNYDLVIENHFKKVSQPDFSDGFAPDYRRITWDISNYQNKSIKLYKLHGSIDWKRASDQGIYCVPEHNFTSHEDNVIIYPGFKGKPGEEPFITIHSQLIKSLMNSNVGIFIGFSFRDEYINEIISAALSENKNLKLIIWNPAKPILPFPEQRLMFLEKTFGDDFKAFNSLEALLKNRILTF